MLPGLVIRDQVRQKLLRHPVVPRDFETGPNCIGGPEAVGARVPAFPKPEDRVVVEIPRVFEPTAFAKVMTGRATDRVVSAGPGDGREEFGDDEAIRG